MYPIVGMGTGEEMLLLREQCEHDLCHIGQLASKTLSIIASTITIHGT